jgi:hypothetical protein
MHPPCHQVVVDVTVLLDRAAEKCTLPGVSKK